MGGKYRRGKSCTLGTITESLCMLDAEKRDTLAALNRGRETLGQALAGVEEDLAGRIPSKGGWSTRRDRESSRRVGKVSAVAAADRGAI